MDVAWIDSETTGLDLGKHEMWQLATIIESDFKVADVAKNFLFAPLYPERASKEALEKTNMTIEKLKSLPDRKKTIRAMIDFFVERKNKTGEKIILAGYNSGFDVKFLQQTFDEVEPGIFWKLFMYEVLDVLPLVWMSRALDMFKSENMKLETVANTLNIQVKSDQGFHDALYDVRVSRLLFYKLCAMTKEHQEALTAGTL
jgi:DNA polymerase III alpha subunit (gram-positive type)